MQLADGSTVRVGIGLGGHVGLYARTEDAVAHVTMTAREAAEMALKLITMSERANGSHIRHLQDDPRQSPA